MDFYIATTYTVVLIFLAFALLRYMPARRSPALAGSLWTSAWVSIFFGLLVLQRFAGELAISSEASVFGDDLKVQLGAFLLEVGVVTVVMLTDRGRNRDVKRDTMG